MTRQLALLPEKCKGGMNLALRVSSCNMLGARIVMKVGHAEIRGFNSATDVMLFGQEGTVRAPLHDLRMHSGQHTMSKYCKKCPADNCRDSPACDAMLARSDALGPCFQPILTVSEPAVAIWMQNAP